MSRACARIGTSPIQTKSVRSLYGSAASITDSLHQVQAACPLFAVRILSLVPPLAVTHHPQVLFTAPALLIVSMCFIVAAMANRTRARIGPLEVGNVTDLARYCTVPECKGRRNAQCEEWLCKHHCMLSGVACKAHKTLGECRTPNGKDTVPPSEGERPEDERPEDEPSFHPADAIAQSTLVDNVDPAEPTVYHSPLVPPSSRSGTASAASSQLRARALVGLGLGGAQQGVSTPARSSSPATPPAVAGSKRSRSPAESNTMDSEERIRRLWEQFLIWVIYPSVRASMRRAVADRAHSRRAGRQASYRR